MDCNETKLRIDTLLTGDLAVEERRLVRCHIRACPKCCGEYRLLKAIVQSMADLPFHEPSARFNARVLFRLGMKLPPVPSRLPVWTKWLISGLLVLTSLWVMFLAFAVRTEFVMLNASKFVAWIENEAHVLISILMGTAEIIRTVAGLLLHESMAILNPLLLSQILVALVIAPVIVMVSINGISTRAKAHGGT